MHGRRLERVSLLQQHDQLVEEPPDLLGALAVDGDLVAPHVDRRVGERRLDQSQQLVALAEEAHHQMVAGNVDLDLGGCHQRSQLRSSAY